MANLLLRERLNRERIAAASVGFAALVALLLAVRQQPAPAAEPARPIVVKAERLRVAAVTPALQQLAPAFAERWQVPEPVRMPGPVTPPPPEESKPVKVAVAKATVADIRQFRAERKKKVRRGVVCVKGRVWYTKKNGWRYWRCRR